eukprot:CAMPEP_0170190756 /NCGR_PEP_ID=MMETSP0040_2-20121228/50071_1 /TAXON_ID=641309 /ORGANISM="Lotharella oceanica, Strain CCMP622" /LENGTH=45 /DNA_ID= /DNA_START= /DNA_END= /DNA_ORIENTATION=
MANAAVLQLAASVEALLAHATSTAVRRCVKADFALHEPCSKIFRV